MRVSLIRPALALFAATLLAIGCSSSATDELVDAAPSAEEHGGDAEAEHGHSHGGWWCGEHGVPEEVCALCDSKVAAEFQKKGDWCKEHDRPDSQCFACHPELEARFAAQYEAKYGEKPPKPQG
jgi:hypothetical protein